MPNPPDEAGLEPRYDVRKLNDPDGKHDDCRYFVLDPQHDPHARTALATYAVLARPEHPQLHADLVVWLAPLIPAAPPTPATSPSTPPPEVERAVTVGLETGTWLDHPEGGITLDEAHRAAKSLLPGTPVLDGVTADPREARIRVEVYIDHKGSFRWTIRSAARGRRIISQASEGYQSKASVFRGLLLTTGGEYVCDWRGRGADGHVLEQGHIERPCPDGVTEHIFVEYLSGAPR